VEPDPEGFDSFDPQQMPSSGESAYTSSLRTPTRATSRSPVSIPSTVNLTSTVCMTPTSERPGSVRTTPTRTHGGNYSGTGASTPTGSSKTITEYVCPIGNHDSATLESETPEKGNYEPWGPLMGRGGSNRMKTVLLGRSSRGFAARQSEALPPVAPRVAPSAGYLFQDSNPPDACVLRRGILAPLTVFVALLG
jgi:hypothetical protein